MRSPIPDVLIGNRKSPIGNLPTFLLNNFRHRARAHRSSAFSYREPQSLLHRDRRDQLDRQLRVVSRHHHLYPFVQRRHSRHVRCPKVKLRPIPAEKRRVPPAFFLRQHVYLGLELRVRRDRSRLRYHLPSLDLLPLHSSQQQPYVVSRHPRVQQLLEHLHARHYRLPRRLDPNDLHFLSYLHLPSLDPSRRHRTSARNRKDVFHRHQEWLIHFARRLRNVAVHCRHQLVYSLLSVSLSVQCLQRASSYDRYLFSGEFIKRQQLAHFKLDQIQQLRIVNRVALVHEHDHRRHSHLPRKQNVLSRLRHRSVCSRNHQDRSVHLRSSGNHVLDVVRVSRAINVRVMPVLGLVFHVRCRDRDSACLLFRRVIDRVERPKLDLRIVLCQHLRDRGRQRRLPVIDVPDRSHVYVRFRTIKFLFSHGI